MTICIGALAQERQQPRIILCFDSKLSAGNDEFSSETGYKFDRLDGRLVSMFAGSPGRAKELVWIYREFLQGVTLDKRSIVDQLREPIKTFKGRHANAYIGRTLGLSYAEFMANRQGWPVDDFKCRLRVIENNPIRVDLVIAGFVGEFPVLCEIRDGEVELKQNYAMVGNGSHTAEPALHFRKHTDQTSLYSALYNTYEAKKQAEASPSVGQFTRMLILSPGETGSYHIDVVRPEGLNHLDNLYDQYGPKPIPFQVEFPENGILRAQ